MSEYTELEREMLVFLTQFEERLPRFSDPDAMSDDVATELGVTWGEVWQIRQMIERITARAGGEG